MLACCGGADTKLISNQNAADSIFDQVAIDLGWKVRSRIFKPLQDLEASFAGKCTQRNLCMHVDN